MTSEFNAEARDSFYSENEIHGKKLVYSSALPKSRKWCWMHCILPMAKPMPMFIAFALWKHTDAYRR